MIGLVEGAKRQKTPNEIALTILLSALTIIFLIVLHVAEGYGIYSRRQSFSITVLVALLVCLIPTTIGGLLSAIGIAGIDRLVQKNVLAMSGRAVEAAGDVDVLLLDKTGTITLGNRQATAFHSRAGRHRTGTGRSGPAFVARRRNAGRPQHCRARQGEVRNPRARAARNAERHFVPFTAQTRMSGVDLRMASQISQRRGRMRFANWVGGRLSETVEAGSRNNLQQWRHTAGRRDERAKCSGVIYLKDIVKGGLTERFERFRAMGIRTVMITGDNR